MATNLSAPSLVGSMRESPLYQTLGVGLTDRIFLLGHADGLPLNDPYQVVSVQEAVNLLGADDASPLLRALLETYYSGARDIFIVAVAPMSEYVEDLTERLVVDGGQTFYQRYQARLAATYQLLLDWDLPRIIVPVEASFIGTDGVDFLTPLADHCQSAFDRTGVIRIGLLGTRGKLDPIAVDSVLDDGRLTSQGPAGKFVSVLLGEAILNIKEIPTTYAASLAATVAGELSTLALDRGLTYHRLRNVVSPSHGDLREATIQALAEKGTNALIRTITGQRGTPFQTVLATDNTVAETGSDYWSLTQLRLVATVLDRLRSFGRASVGTIDYPQFRSDVYDYLNSLVANEVIRDYRADVHPDESNRSRIQVDVALRPFFGVRELVFTAAVGPAGGFQ